MNFQTNKEKLTKVKNFIWSKKWLIIFLALVLIAVGFFVAKSRKSPEELYEIREVEKKDLENIISASGKITASEKATLKFQTSGRLAWVGVKEGDYVNAWQAIAGLDQNELQKTLKQELLDYMNERWDFEKTTKVDYRDQALTETIRIAKEKAQFDLDRVVLDVEIADIALKYAVLVTPIAGIVIKAEPQMPGINVTSTVGNVAEYIIANPEKLVFEAQIDEADIGSISMGKRVKITLDAFPEREFQGTVTRIGFSAETTSSGGTAFPVQITIDTPPELRIGMNGDTEIVSEKRENVLVIPFTALIEKDGKTSVQVVEEGKIKEREVKIGMEGETEIEILEGLKEDDKIVTGKKAKKG